MGRKQSYFCDTCQNVFGNTSHLNLEGIHLRVAYKQNGHWKTKRFPPTRQNQFHFCNSICLNEWIAIQADGLLEQVGGNNAQSPR